VEEDEPEDRERKHEWLSLLIKQTGDLFLKLEQEEGQ